MFSHEFVDESVEYGVDARTIAEVGGDAVDSPLGEVLLDERLGCERLRLRRFDRRVLDDRAAPALVPDEHASHGSVVPFGGGKRVAVGSEVPGR